MEKFAIQDAQYGFPYHHIPGIDPEGRACRHRLLRWGFEYLCYTRHLHEKVRSLDPDSLLDAGCGEGMFIKLLSDLNIARLAGVDLSKKAVAFAQAFNPGITFHQQPLSQLSETYDLVTAIEVLEHIPDDSITDFIGDLLGKVRSGGHLLISVPTINLPPNPKHYRHYDENLLRAQFKQCPVPHEMVEVEYVFNGNDLFYKLWKRLTGKRFHYLSISCLDQWMWNRIWKKLRTTGARHGFHLVALIRASNTSNHH